MNRYMVGMAMVLLLATADAVAGQTRARVEYRNGRIDVGVNIGRLPVRVSPHGPTARGWVAADWGPVRIRVASQRPMRTHGILDRKDLRYLLGKETVKRIERHAKNMGIRGRTLGQWYRADRNATVLEVTVDRIPVAELWDYRNDGRIDELFLTAPRGYDRFRDDRYKGPAGERRYDWGDIRYRQYREP